MNGPFVKVGGVLGIIKAAGDLVTVGSLGVIFDDPTTPGRDLVGDYFTAKSYFGAHGGDGVDMSFHHGIPISADAFAKSLATNLFPAVKAEVSEEGIVAKVVLDKRKQYERFVIERVQEKALSWSSGANHLVQRADDGWLKVWPITEWAATPTPAEPRLGALDLKSLFPPSVKAEGLEARLSRIYDAWWMAFEDGYVVEVFDDHVIASWFSTLYRVPITITDTSVDFADRGMWEEVERVVDFVAAKGLYDHITRTRRMDTGDMIRTLELQNLNLQLSLQG